MNFVMGLSAIFHKNNAIWVIEDWLTKTARVIPIKTDFPLSSWETCTLEKWLSCIGYLLTLYQIGINYFLLSFG